MNKFVVSALAASLLTSSAVLLAASAATADPEDLEPTCSSGQIPEAGACTPQTNDVYVDDAPGADPEVPLGLNPETVPAI